MCFVCVGQLAFVADFIGFLGDILYCKNSLNTHENTLEKCFFPVTIISITVLFVMLKFFDSLR